MNQPCPICGEERPSFPVLDSITGWRFCGDCFHGARAAMEERTFPAWLRAIAKLHEEKHANATQDVHVIGIHEVGGE